METSYFPLFVNLWDSKIVVIGGGKIARRRVEVLSSFAWDITVIAPEITESLLNLEKENRIRCILREYKEEDIDHADMVLAATDNKELNKKIAKDSWAAREKKGRRILVNVADDKKLCDFYFPSVICKDEIVIGMNSGGRVPGKVKELRKKLEEELKKETEG